MTDIIKRQQDKIQKLLDERVNAYRRNDLMGIARIDKKIREINEEVENIKKREQVRLSQALSHDDMVKDDIYRKLLKCSLAADYLNECCWAVKETLKKHGLSDFSFRKDIDTVIKMTNDIASLVIIPNQTVLTDMIVDDDEFVKTCDEAAEKHLKQALNI